MTSKTLRTFLIVLVPILGALGACKSSPPESGPETTMRIAMPDNPEADAQARAAVGKRTVLLANKIELYLPPALYAEVTCTPATHSQNEFATKAGRRISMKPPEGGAALATPARVKVGKWEFASHGPIEILFIVEKDAAAARARATGVTLVSREGAEFKNLGFVGLDDDRLTVRQNP